MPPIPAIFDLTGKVAVVTGSTKGIGKAIAARMAEHGAHVIVSSRRADACAAVAAEIRNEWAARGAETIGVPCDIARLADCDALIAAARERFGRVDILVCNAAVNRFLGSMMDISEAVFDETMACNVKSNWWLCKAVLPEMRARRDGVVIMIGSTGGIRGNRDLGTYGMAKAADMQLVRNITAEFGPDNIRANCIAPGLVRTDMAAALWADPKRHALARRTYPLQRLGEPDDIAGIAVMLASPAGAWMSGQTIPVDGGMTAAVGRYFDGPYDTPPARRGPE